MSTTVKVKGGKFCDLNPCKHMVSVVMMVDTEVTTFSASLSFLQCSDDMVKMSFTLLKNKNSVFWLYT